ncbi:MAG TPA: NUDIX domain-containing protein [Flavisolibacter sp.]|nr:NUDIX domain-containing protein [Flavisolibacter sp.]
MANVKITNTEILSQTKYSLKNIHFDLQKEDGSWEAQEKEVYERSNSATALLYNKERHTVILTQQFRLPTYLNGNPSGMLLETCAGLLDKGEDPEDTIKREIEEETGYVVHTVQKVYEAYTSAGALTELSHLYVAEYNQKQKASEGGGLKEEKEDIKIVELSFDEAIRMMNEGAIRDVKALILLQYARLNQLL